MLSSANELRTDCCIHGEEMNEEKGDAPFGGGGNGGLRGFGRLNFVSTQGC